MLDELMSPFTVRGFCASRKFQVQAPEDFLHDVFLLITLSASNRPGRDKRKGHLLLCHVWDQCFDAVCWFDCFSYVFRILSHTPLHAALRDNFFHLPRKKNRLEPNGLTRDKAQDQQNINKPQLIQYDQIANNKVTPELAALAFLDPRFLDSVEEICHGCPQAWECVRYVPKQSIA